MVRRDAQVNIAPTARGGLSWGAVLTGVVVAFGSMVILSSIVTSVLAAVGVIDNEVTSGDVADAALPAGIALVIAQFLSYLWGGYAAGRMARGAGLLNGLLVPLFAVLISIALAAVLVSVLSDEVQLEPPYTSFELAGDYGDNAAEWGIGIGVAALVAMFVGGAVGGTAGARWHTKLERDTYETQRHDSEAAQPTWDEQVRQERDSASDPSAVAWSDTDPRSGATTSGAPGASTTTDHTATEPAGEPPPPPVADERDTSTGGTFRDDTGESDTTTRRDPAP